MSCSLDPKAARSAPLYLAILFLALFNASTLFAQDLPEARETQVWLVTYGPGEIYWQRFGHNAIWIRDRERGLDHAFNFGFFDFEQENFFLRFLQGRMLYFSAARPAQDEFTAYINENRSIRAQRLDLSVDQKEHLTRFLLNEIKPENRDYLYDYYRNNCSTRVRDALDMGLGGLLREKFEPLAGAQTWREHTRRLTVDDFWLYLGLEIVLGATIDREIDRWDELFIPSELAGALTGLAVADAGRSRPLVLEDLVLFESTLTAPPGSPVSSWLRYLLAALAAVIGVWALCRLAPGAWGAAVCSAWLMIAGLAGCALLFFWFGTDHVVASTNLNLLVFNPLWLLLVFWNGQERIALSVVMISAALALLMNVIPPDQYNLDVIAAFVPLNIAAGVGLVRCRPRRAGLRDVPASAGR
jgi:hypothetical protein